MQVWSACSPLSGADNTPSPTKVIRQHELNREISSQILSIRRFHNLCCRNQQRWFQRQFNPARCMGSRSAYLQFRIVRRPGNGDQYLCMTQINALEDLVTMRFTCRIKADGWGGLKPAIRTFCTCKHYIRVDEREPEYS